MVTGPSQEAKKELYQKREMTSFPDADHTVPGYYYLSMGDTSNPHSQESDVFLHHHQTGLPYSSCSIRKLHWLNLNESSKTKMNQTLVSSPSMQGEDSNHERFHNMYVKAPATHICSQWLTQFSKQKLF